MLEARAVLGGGERSEAIERERADARLLLPELRELVAEATAWAKRERDPRAIEAAAALEEAREARLPERVAS
jgi:hypothetical protein